MIDATPIRTFGDEWINPAAAVLFMLPSVDPPFVVLTMPSGQQIQFEGEKALEVAQVWGIADEEGNFPPDLATEVNRAQASKKLAAGAQNGGPVRMPDGQNHLRPLE